MWRYHVKYRVAGLIKEGIIMKDQFGRNLTDNAELALFRIADILEEILKLQRFKQQATSVKHQAKKALDSHKIPDIK